MRLFPVKWLSDFLPRAGKAEGQLNLSTGTGD